MYVHLSFLLIIYVSIFGLSIYLFIYLSIVYQFICLFIYLLTYNVYKYTL